MKQLIILFVTLVCANVYAQQSKEDFSKINNQLCRESATYNWLLSDKGWKGLKASIEKRYKKVGKVSIVKMPKLLRTQTEGGTLICQVPVIIRYNKVTPWTRNIDMYPFPNATIVKDKKMVVTAVTWNAIGAEPKPRFAAPSN